LKPLKGLRQVVHLFLEDNEIRDLGPLIEMAREDMEGEKRFAPFLNVYLEGNDTDELMRKGQVHALRDLGVKVEI
jgi:hypothetical protein